MLSSSTFTVSSLTYKTLIYFELSLYVLNKFIESTEKLQCYIRTWNSLTFYPLFFTTHVLEVVVALGKWSEGGSPRALPTTNIRTQGPAQ